MAVTPSSLRLGSSLFGFFGSHPDNLPPVAGAASEGAAGDDASAGDRLRVAGLDEQALAATALERLMRAFYASETAMREETEHLRRINEMQQAIATSGLDVHEVMQVLVDRTLPFAGADATAAGLLDGGEIIFDAVAGDALPHAGIRLPTDGLLAAALQSGEIVHCSDTETDARANQDRNRQLGIRSLVVVPLRDGDKVVGLLAVMWRRPTAFSERNVQTLQLIAGVLSAAVGRALAFQANVRLLAERTEALAALRRSEQQLVKVQKLKAIGQLAAGMAHEINTPTQYVSDNLRFLDQALHDVLALVGEYERLAAAARAEGVLTEVLPQVERSAERTDVAYLRVELPVAIRQSLDGLERIAKIVHGVKAFSRRESEEKKPVDLNAEIENTVTVSRNEWKYVADLETGLDPALPPVPCVAGEINQVVLTLLINAAHAIADHVREHPGTKGRITVSTRRVGDWVELRVRDTGTGIPEAVRSRIFEPFFTTKDVGKGMGQGLAIAHTVVVETHGGTIDFETATGEGTTFVVRLPLAGGCPDGAGAAS